MNKTLNLWQQLRWPAAVVAAVALLKLPIALSLPIHPDEAYYWIWSRFPAWSYYDQGPATGHYIALFTTLFGESHFAIRFGGLFAATLATLLFLASAVELGLTRRKLWLFTMALTIVPGYFAGSLLMMHDSLLILAWSAAIFTAIRYLRRRRPLELYLLFIALGLGALSKHTMLFAALALIIWFVLQPREWPLLQSRHFWIGMLLAALLTTPIWIWNLDNSWAGVGAIIHLRSSGGAHSAGGDSGLYLIGQLLSLSPLWLLLSLTTFSILRRSHESLSGEIGISIRRLLLWQAWILPLFFLALSTRREVQANWVYPAYGPLLLLMIDQLHYVARTRGDEKRPVGRRLGSRVWRTLEPGLFWGGTIFAVSLSLFATFSVPIVRLLSLPIDTYSIPGYRAAGYAEASEELLKFRSEINPAARLAANRYQDAAIASWHLPGKPHIPSINVLQRNQYSYLPGLEKGEDYIIFAFYTDVRYHTPMLLLPVLESMCDSVREFPVGEVILDGRVVKRYQFWYCENYHSPWDQQFYDYMIRDSIFDLMPEQRLARKRLARAARGASSEQQADQATVSAITVGSSDFLRYLEESSAQLCQRMIECSQRLVRTASPAMQNSITTAACHERIGEKMAQRSLLLNQAEQQLARDCHAATLEASCAQMAMPSVWHPACAELRRRYDRE